MRADIHDGPEHMLQTETEYIDARPHQPASTKSLLHRAAGPYIRVNRHTPPAAKPPKSPLRVRKRTRFRSLALWHMLLDSVTEPRSMAMQDQLNAPPTPKRVPWNKGK